MGQNVYHVRGIATRGGCMAVRVLLVVAAFAVLYGCGQTNSPPEKQEKQAGAEQVAREKDENKVATKEKAASGFTKAEQKKADTAKAAASASALESASASAQGENSPAEERQRVMELECTLDRYAQENYLSVNEQQALTDKALNIKEAHMERYPNDTDYYILDAYYELGVPDYGDYCEVAGE
jgi:hypothetical protein